MNQTAIAMMKFHYQNTACFYLCSLRVIRRHMGNRVSLSLHAQSRIIAFWNRRAHSTKISWDLCEKCIISSLSGGNAARGEGGCTQAAHRRHHHSLCGWVAETWWWLAAILLLLAHCHSICQMRQLALLLLQTPNHFLATLFSCTETA